MTTSWCPSAAGIWPAAIDARMLHKTKTKWLDRRLREVVYSTFIASMSFSQGTSMAALPRIACGVRSLLSVAIVLTAVAPLPAQRGGRGAEAGAYKLRITPNWFDGGEQFWYRNDLPGGKSEFVVVERGKASETRV